MPNYVLFYRKEMPKRDPNPAVAPQIIDAEMCKHFGVPEHPKHWYLGWFDCIGFSLACGATLPKLMAECPIDATEYQQKYLAALQWLDANFTVDAFCRRD